MNGHDLFEMIRKAADAGDQFAQNELGVAYDYGNLGLGQDFEKASEWYGRAARQGHQSAEINLLLQNVFGQARTLEPAVVFNRLKEIAEAGDLEAQNNVGLCFQFGYGTEQNYSEAASWFRRAAEGGSPTAQFNLGGFYLNGKGLQKDVAQAIAWYTRAAEQRHELALIQLGSLYRWGDGVKPDQNRALVLFLIAYGRGSTRAANHLALMFKKGLGVERDDSMAYELFVESLSGPDTPEVADNNLSYRGTAYYWLGYMTENGEGGLKRDLRAAKKWYRRGADCDQSNCIKALARLSSKTSDKRCRNKQP
jgi:TPR repeat protein